MISIILPVFNEEKNIGRVLGNVSSFFSEIKLPFEIIAVNDGSKDKTSEILNKYSGLKNIKIVLHEKNLGYGTALRSGFNAAQGDLIFFTDSDGQFDVKDIIPFLDKIKNYDFVAGFRENRKDPFIRILYAKMFGIASRIFFRVKVKDIDCAFKLFNSRVIKNMKLVSGGALINLEIFARAKKAGYKFVELPVNHFERTHGRQTGGSLKVVFKAMRQFFLLLLRFYFDS